MENNDEICDFCIENFYYNHNLLKNIGDDKLYNIYTYSFENFFEFDKLSINSNLKLFAVYLIKNFENERAFIYTNESNNVKIINELYYCELCNFIIKNLHIGIEKLTIDLSYFGHLII